MHLRSRFAVFLALLLCIYVLIPQNAQAQALNEGFKIIGPATSQPRSDVVTFGCPLAENLAVTSINTLRVLDAFNNPVPAQFRVLSGWGATAANVSAAHPIKFVQITMPATLPATSGIQSEATGFHLVTNPAGPAQGQLALTQGSNFVQITTGTGTVFRLRTDKFIPFERITLANGQNLIDVPTGASAGIQVVDLNSVLLPVAVTAFDVPQSGTVMTELRWKGTIGPVLTFTATLRFYSQKDFVDATFRVENERPHGFHGWFVNNPQLCLTNGTKRFNSSGQCLVDNNQYEKSIRIAQPLNASATGSNVVVTTTLGSRIGTGTEFYLKQELSRTSTAARAEDRVGFTENLNLATPINHLPGRYPGALDVSVSGTGSITTAIKDFWQTAPRGFSVHNNLLSIDLMPDGFANWQPMEISSGGNYYFCTNSNQNCDSNTENFYTVEGGRHLSTAIRFSVSTTSPTATDVQRQADYTQPLVGFPANPAFVRWATGLVLYEEEPLSSDTATGLFNRLVRLGFDNSVANNGVSLPEFLARGGTSLNSQTFGFERFGDVPWGGNSGHGAMQHYGLSEQLWAKGFLRTGDYRAFQMAHRATTYLRNYGINHARLTSPEDPWRGYQFYETQSNVGMNTHNWTRGLAIDYSFTGNDEDLEAIAKNAAAMAKDIPPAACYASRSFSHTAENLTAFAFHTGDPNYVATAYANLAAFLGCESTTYSNLINDGGGHIWTNTNPELGPDDSTWQGHGALDSTILLAELTNDPTLIPVITRMVTFFSNAGTPPYGNLTNRFIGYGVDHLTPNWNSNQPPPAGIHPKYSNSILHMAALSDATCQGAIFFNDSNLYQKCMDWYNSVLRYREHWVLPDFNHPNTFGWTLDFTNPSSFDPIRFNSNCNGTELKCWGSMIIAMGAQEYAKHIFSGVPWPAITPVPSSPPAAPSGLIASAVVSKGIPATILLWLDNSPNAANSNSELGFKVSRRITPMAGNPGPWVAYYTLPPGRTAFEDDNRGLCPNCVTGLTVGSTYEYKITAYNSVGDSTDSNIVSAVAIGIAPPPPSPVPLPTPSPVNPNSYAALNFLLVRNYPVSTVIATLQDGQTIDLSQVNIGTGVHFQVAFNQPLPNSVRSTINGQFTKCSNHLSLGRYMVSTSDVVQMPATGSTVLAAEPHTAAGCAGLAGAPYSITVNVINAGGVSPSPSSSPSIMPSSSPSAGPEPSPSPSPGSGGPDFTPESNSNATLGASYKIRQLKLALGITDSLGTILPPNTYTSCKVTISTALTKNKKVAPTASSFRPIRTVSLSSIYRKNYILKKPPLVKTPVYLTFKASGSCLDSLANTISLTQKTTQVKLPINAGGISANKLTSKLKKLAPKFLR